jgi:hypothetical protein
MSAFDQLRNDLLSSVQPVRPVWRMQCRCRFRPGRPGEITACECGYWRRAGQRGRRRPISAPRAFRVLVPGLMRELSCFELTGGWPEG